MDANLTAFSTEDLMQLLAAKKKKPQNEITRQVIEAIQNELAARK